MDRTIVRVEAIDRQPDLLIRVGIGLLVEVLQAAPETEVATALESHFDSSTSQAKREKIVSRSDRDHLPAL